jgi:hypothetical protein
LLSRSLWNIALYLDLTLQANVDRGGTVGGDSIVRTEAAKLHMRLTSYYSEEGFADRLVAPLLRVPSRSTVVPSPPTRKIFDIH